MCIRDSCYSLSQAVFLTPADVDTENTNNAIKLLLIGKRNIVKVLNIGQAYCACEHIAGEGKRLDVFYKFYAENK